MDGSPSWLANIVSATQEIARLFRELTSEEVSVLSYFERDEFNTHFYTLIISGQLSIILPCTRRFPKWPLFITFRNKLVSLKRDSNPPSRPQMRWNRIVVCLTETIDGVWIGNWPAVTTNKYDNLTELHTPKITATVVHMKSF
jgi:hypothetical protein